MTLPHSSNHTIKKKKTEYADQKETVWLFIQALILPRCYQREWGGPQLSQRIKEETDCKWCQGVEWSGKAF